MGPTLHLFLLLFLSLLLSFSSHVAAQQSSTTTTLQPGGTVQQDPTTGVSYRPRVAVVIGIFSIMLSVTFLLLMYAKFCYNAGRTDLFGGHDPEGRQNHHDGIFPLRQPLSSSGVDKTVIESLPFFRFSSLKGSREGLECAVCLSRFDGAELLRLLPKCKHAFHIACVDRWLEGHSTCPLCRSPVLVEDLTLFKYSTSSRFVLRDPSAPAGEADLELYVERMPGEEASTGSLGTSFRKMVRAGKEKKDPEALLADQGGGGHGGEEQQQQFYHRFKHRIIVSDVVFKNRWSDLNSSDLVSLNSEMLRSLSSRRFPAAAGMEASSEEEKGPSRPDQSEISADETIRRIKEEMERKRALESKASQINGDLAGAGSPPSGSDDKNRQGSTLPRSLNPSANNRAMSEIINISRFDDASRGATDGSNTTEVSISKKEEKVRRVWLPIARRTVKWSAGREKRSESEKTTAESNV